MKFLVSDDARKRCFASQVNTEIGKRERARLREMQRMKKHKVQEILAAQNAAIDADMVSVS